MFEQGVDFARAKDDYAQHRLGFPPRFYEELGRRGLLRAGLAAVDVGTGTGAVARELARAGCDVTGVDISHGMLDAGARLDDAAGVSTHRVLAPAEGTTLPAASFDLVTAGQCWHWFDGPRAAAECARLLAPGGRVVIASFDWLPLPGSAVAAMEELLLRFNPSWPTSHGTGIDARPLAHLAAAGFVDLETFGFDVAQPYTHAGWLGRIRASAWVGGSLPPDEVARFDAEHAALLERDFPKDPLIAPHRVFAIVATAPEARTQRP